MTKLTRIEEVKKITHPFCFEKTIGFAVEACPHPDNSICQSCEDEAHQICQLFPQPLPEGMYFETVKLNDGAKETVTLCKPQPLDDKELREKIPQTYKEFVEIYGKRPPDIVFALLQLKIEEAKREERERIFDGIELVVLNELNQNLNNYPWWQALKGESK